MRSAILLSSYFVDVRFDMGSKVTGDGAATTFFVWTGFSFNTIGWDVISSTKVVRYYQVRVTADGMDANGLYIGEISVWPDVYSSLFLL